MSWVSERTGTFHDLLGLRANLFSDYQAFTAVFSEHKLLDEELMRLCHLRVAQLHRCPSQEQALRSQLPKAKLTALAQWYRAPEFSSLEKAALQLTECFCMDTHSISDAMAAAVVAEIGDKGLVALLEYLALCDGFVRFQVVLQTGEPL
ncbi:MAG: alkylhydroperoxidase family enzyme [Bacteroidia bacterium]|jgi:alkylhydroperoxidase family enzyme